MLPKNEKKGDDSRNVNTVGANVWGPEDFFNSFWDKQVTPLNYIHGKCFCFYEEVTTRFHSQSQDVTFVFIFSACFSYPALQNVH